MRFPELKNEQFFIRNFSNLILLPNFLNYIHILPYLIDKPSSQFLDAVNAHKLADDHA